jgi:hypothetical protein
MKRKWSHRLVIHETAQPGRFCHAAATWRNKAMETKAIKSFCGACRRENRLELTR